MISLQNMQLSFRDSRTLASAIDWNNRAVFTLQPVEGYPSERWTMRLDRLNAYSVHDSIESAIANANRIMEA